MAGQVQVDTAQMIATAQQSANKADNMITHAKTLRTGIEFVSTRWQGQAGDTFRMTMQNQTTILDQLIQRLTTVSELVNRGGQGLEGQDSAGRQKLANQGGNFLGGSLNR